MVEVSVCVGSSCHMKGSYQVIKTFTELIKQNHLENIVTHKASFCMGKCLEAIACTVNGEILTKVGFANAEQVFYEHIYPLAQQQAGGETL